jgi:predicted nucleic acid-binding protein
MSADTNRPKIANQPISRAFFDTNILVYLQSVTEADKRLIARQLVDRAQDAVISTQVLNELSNVLVGKHHMGFDAARAIIIATAQAYTVREINASTCVHALFVMEENQLSYYDSLIVAAALEAGCDILFSEDMQDGRRIEKRLQIINPFNAMSN